MVVYNNRWERMNDSAETVSGVVVEAVTVSQKCCTRCGWCHDPVRVIVCVFQFMLFVSFSHTHIQPPHTTKCLVACLGRMVKQASMIATTPLQFESYRKSTKPPEKQREKVIPPTKRESVCLCNVGRTTSRVWQRQEQNSSANKRHLALSRASQSCVSLATCTTTRSAKSCGRYEIIMGNWLCHCAEPTPH
jgi:hypothetical protein